MAAQLIEQTGSRRRIRLGGIRQSLGRAPENDIVVEDSKASRKHAVIYAQGDQYYIEDAGSANGTYVNGVKVRQAELYPGSILKIAGSEFLFDATREATPYPLAPRGGDQSLGPVPDSRTLRRFATVWIGIGGAMIVGALLFFFVPWYQVHDGTLVECELCGSEITNTVHVVNASYFERDKYSVNKSLKMCSACGNAPIEYVVYTHCKSCGQVYQKENKTAARRENPQDINRTEGFCVECSTIPIPYVVNTHCKRCGKTYLTEHKSAPRRDNPQDANITEGYCCGACQLADEGENFFDKVKEGYEENKPWWLQ